MSSLRGKLIWIFVLGTLAPLAGLAWIADSLLEHSLTYSTTAQVDWLSRVLEKTGREYYQLSREQLRQEAQNGAVTGERFRAANRESWPRHIQAFASSGEQEAFQTSGRKADVLQYLIQDHGDVLQFERSLGAVAMGEISSAIRGARGSVETARSRDLRRGFLYTILLFAAGIWLVSILVLAFAANRMTKPIRQLTAGLAALASGDLSRRIPIRRGDEIGEAIDAFNHTAAELAESRERALEMARMESWQTLARKTAHEVKNSLTPIRLNVEEIVARSGEPERAGVQQAAQIIVDEIQMLERRVRAFSELGAEPPIRKQPIDLNASVEERISFLRQARPDVAYQAELSTGPLPALADPDLVRGVLTNLMQNAAEAAGAGGVVMLRTVLSSGTACVEVHDSGPGLSPNARQTLFEPSISFKRGGMGLGLSIARKGVLSCGGDIELIPGCLGGAAFRVQLPAAS